MTITIGRIEYVPHSIYSRLKAAENVEYLGIVPRKSDGIHCLSFKRQNSSRAYNVEVGLVYSVQVSDRRWIRPNTDSFYWRERAAELRSFIEQIDVSAADFD
jgi:hypothetical protein